MNEIFTFLENRGESIDQFFKDIKVMDNTIVDQECLKKIIDGADVSKIKFNIFKMTDQVKKLGPNYTVGKFKM